MTTPAKTHGSHNAEASAKSAKASKAAFEIKPSFADDGTPRFAIFKKDGEVEAFVRHVESEAQAEALVKSLESHNEAEAEAQKLRDKRRDANKAAGFHAAERRGEPVPPEMHRFAEQHDRASERA